MRTGSFHDGCAALSTDTSTSTKLPSEAGNPDGAAIVVVALRVSPSGRVSPVMLSKFDHVALYLADAFSPAATAAFWNVSEPFVSRRGLTTGLIAVR